MGTLTDRQRFWQKVCIGADDECWNWLGCLTLGGHGQFWVNGKHVYAHRYSKSLLEEIPAHKIVCHKCDNASCVNPNHLYVGTYSENMRDKARTPAHFQPDNAGEKHGLAKLTEQDVRDIRSSILSERKLAKVMNVSPRTIGLIRSRKRWRHVA
jgi:hypothetical protein